jgi:hypothetical protein
LFIIYFFRYFIGSYVSTFSFRIQEEREILGFDSETTFNRLCSETEENCEQPSKWQIVYWWMYYIDLSSNLNNYMLEFSPF